jgi:cellulose synthase/poly-beta-1,6-N-acetylglucosamine synthase-like glycosyltransferase
MGLPALESHPRARHQRRVTPNASVFLSRGQLLAVLLILGAIAASSYYRPRLTVTAAVAACIAFYIVTALLKLVITLAGRNYRPPRRIRVWPGDPTLPTYAVLLPVHKEANMLGHLVSRVDKLTYPRRKLRVLLLIEHDDLETLQAARRLGIPFHRGPGRTAASEHLQVVVIPPGGPKTKPNAMNVAMGIVVKERCEFVTIYDAEDRPEFDQLLKAVGTFRAATPELACLQAELAFWNDNTNWVTALYWIGYKIHFTRFLPGLARLGLPIPLGGTSNHFRVSALLDVALRPGGQVWDPHNLTEDADLGARLATAGYRVELLLSTTMEEAPVAVKVVDKQQRRWKAGYLQTGLVHTRRPLRSMRRMGPVRWLCFNLLILGGPISLLLNPLFVALTVVYFATRSQLIVGLFPTAVYYPSVALMLLGNLGLLYELVHTCVQEAEQARGRFDLVRYMLLAQLMWLWMSRSTYIAVFELVTGKRTWHKTPHGHAEDEEPRFRLQRQPRPAGWQPARHPPPPGLQTWQPAQQPPPPDWQSARQPRPPARQPARQYPPPAWQTRQPPPPGRQPARQPPPPTRQTPPPTRQTRPPAGSPSHSPGTR